MSDTIERIKKVTAEVLKVDPNTIANDARFVEDLGAESVQSIEMVAAFEEEFEIELDEEDALKIKDVKNAAEFIEKALEEDA